MLLQNNVVDFGYIPSPDECYFSQSIYGSSRELKVTIEQAKVAVSNGFPVLLRGEVGTGKALFAQAIHYASERATEQFTRVNCASDHSGNIERLLFGTADEEQCLFRTLNGGTLYLAEVTALSRQAQQMLYVYITTGHLQKNGTEEGTTVDVKVIVGTSENIEQAVANDSFSEKLYYALLQIAIYIVPIRQRTADIMPIAMHIVQKLNDKIGMNIQTIELAAENWLVQQQWRGNVHEIENVLSQAMIYMSHRDATIRLENIVKLPVTTAETQSIHNEESTLTSLMDNYERSVLSEALQHHEEDKAALANKLGISLRSLYYKLEKYKLLDRY